MERTKQLYQKTKQALQLTIQNNPNKAITILKDILKEILKLKNKNTEILQQLISLEIITYNNLACAYNKKGKYKASLFYLQTVNKMEQQRVKNIKNWENVPQLVHQIATTHSNLCAVYSQMGDNRRAVIFIAAAITLLQKNQQTKKSQALIVFYYNYAVQLENLGLLQQSKKIANHGISLIVFQISNKQVKPLLEELLNRIETKIKKKQKKLALNIQKSFQTFYLPRSPFKKNRKRQLSHNQISIHQNSLPDNKIKITRESPLSKYIPKLTQYPAIKISKTLQTIDKMNQSKFSRNKLDSFAMYQPPRQQFRNSRFKRLRNRPISIQTINVLHLKNLI